MEKAEFQIYRNVKPGYSFSIVSKPTQSPSNHNVALFYLIVAKTGVRLARTAFASGDQAWPGLQVECVLGWWEKCYGRVLILSLIITDKTTFLNFPISLILLMFYTYCLS